MFVYNVVHPITATISGSDLKTAIKTFIKANYMMNLQHIILRDQHKYWKADFNYYTPHGRSKKSNTKKVGINYYPAPLNLIGSLGLPMLPLVSPMVQTGHVISPQGPIVGPGYDIGPSVASVMSPLVGLGLGLGKAKKFDDLKLAITPFGLTAIGSSKDEKEKEEEDKKIKVEDLLDLEKLKKAYDDIGEGADKEAEKNKAKDAYNKKWEEIDGILKDGKLEKLKFEKIA